MASAPAAAATPAAPKYCEDLRAPVATVVGDTPHARMHRVEWRKLMAGEPLEINPSLGSGFRVMSVEEWAARWKANPDMPACLCCGGTNTKEHYFTQTWCRGRRLWECEALCLDCLAFSFRAYRDPDFMTPEEHAKEMWTRVARGDDAGMATA